MDSLTLDQFVVFVTVAKEGSFSAAARRLNRAQSAVTYAVQNLELQVGTDLFDRSSYRPRLSPTGQALLPRAKRILEEVTAWRTQTQSLMQGVEARLTIAVDMVAPTEPIIWTLKALSATFPMIEVKLLAQPLEATIALIRQGHADLGIIIDVLGSDLEDMDRRNCGWTDFVMVAAPDHPLARMNAPLRHEDLHDHTQLLLSSGPDGGRDWVAFAVNRWRINDLSFRHRLLLAGVGWSSMPLHLVVEDLRAGRLVALELDPVSVKEKTPKLSFSVAHLRTTPLGRAGRWLVEQLVLRQNELNAQAS
jgi:DNA-binding transcriptional LysR family regulator